MPPATASQSTTAVATPDANTVAPGAAGIVESIENAAVDRAGLKATFELFNRMSDDLAESYRALELRVSALTEELNRVNRQREQELRSKEQVTSRLSNLLDLLPGGVVVLDRWGKVSQSNPAAEELLGKNLVGRRWVDLIAEYFAPRKDDWHEISLKNGKRVSLSTRSLEAETGQIILLTDQTETRHLQEQVSRNERLSALGHMVSALAHQIRTPLSAAILYAGHLCERELPPEQTKKFSNKIASRLNHLEQQVRDMLIFAKGDVKLGDRVSVDDLLADLQQAIDVPVAAAGVQLQVTNDCAGQYLLCNRQAMVGALANLVNNALQASGPDEDIQLKASYSVGNIHLQIEDQGQGIAEDVLQRIHSEEAFVSTKSQGTGLGLAVVRAVARAHAGEFSINSQPGRGTRAKICLPADVGGDR